MRTPMGKARKGSFKDMTVQELLIAFFKASKEKIGIDPALIGDITVGTYGVVAAARET